MSPILHYALRLGGGLLLGSSESIGPFSDLFTTLDGRHRIFCKKTASASIAPDFSPFVTQGSTLRRFNREAGGPLWSALDVQREADRIVLSRYAPVGVVIDDSGTVLQFRGRTVDYLEPAPGLASLDLMRMVRSGLLAELRSAVNQARAESMAVIKEWIAPHRHGHRNCVHIEVVPFKVPPSEARFFLILFQDTTTAAASARPASCRAVAVGHGAAGWAPCNRSSPALRGVLAIGV